MQFLGGFGGHFNLTVFEDLKPKLETLNPKLPEPAPQVCPDAKLATGVTFDLVIEEAEILLGFKTLRFKGFDG